MGAVSQGSLGGRSPCLQGQTAGDILLQFSLSVYLPFLSLCPFTAVSPQRATGPASCNTRGWADFQSLPSSSSSSARKVVLARCQNSSRLLCCHSLLPPALQPLTSIPATYSMVQSTHFGCTGGWISWMSLYAVDRCFFFSFWLWTS